MFSMSILDSDAFLDMPQSTQNLYMHMAMRADDDGFLGNPKKIIRMTGCGDDDYKILISKKFVIPFESGICVIKHWLIHNTIRRDRYEETTYCDEKKLLDMAENKAYSVGLPSGNQMATSGCHSIEENSIEKNSKEETGGRVSFGEFQKVKITTDEKSKLDEKYGRAATSILIDELDQYLESTGKKYKSHYATLLAWARRKQLAVVARPAVAASTDLTPEEVEANRARLARIREARS